MSTAAARPPEERTIPLTSLNELIGATPANSDITYAYKMDSTLEVGVLPSFASESKSCLYSSDYITILSPYGYDSIDFENPLIKAFILSQLLPSYDWTKLCNLCRPQFPHSHKRKSKDEITVSALVKITDANMDIVYKDMVTKMQQEVTVQQIMSQIANVKKDMIILEKSEFSALRAENEKINVELHRLKQQIMDEAIKIRTDTKLDFNLEKSRVKELYSLNERKLLEMRTEMVALHAQQDRAVTQTDRKIDTEVAGLKTMLESHKLDNIKYLAGSVFTCLTVALGFYRLWI
ncbi:mitochondrial calcium uniporter regulator 1-like [Vulpes lagopus]|uniref:mitochondrial calcium uniporter regulator 1-like n=1 Tax=Vulpes lagopus TaxID=494514 RepID=UPI001BC9DB3A|nr:mitochondrial calcium uniporter regulator 1-like [Vulpes lagopus]